MSSNNTENAQGGFEQSAISFLLSIVGSLAIFLGVGSSFFFFITDEDTRRGFHNVFMGLLLVGPLVADLLFHAASLTLDAVQETAKNTRDMLKIMRD